MNILAVDSSGPVLSAALSFRGRQYALTRRESARPHDEMIFPLVAGLLRRAGLRLEDLSAVAAASGPGRFTGIRIAMAYAAVTAGALKIPAVAISRLEAAAFARGPGRFCAAIKGPREEVFYQGFVVKPGGAAPKPTAPPAWAQGHEWPKMRRSFARRGFEVFESEPGAREILGAALRRLSAGALPLFEPLYLKTAGYERKPHPTGPAR